jgi:hypothetical protein
MKSYKVKNLEAELKKSNRIAASIKEMIDAHSGPAWSKNNLIKDYNKQVRISKIIKDSLLSEIAKG